MISTDLSRRYNSYSDLIRDLETARRSMMAEPVTEEIVAPPQAEIILRGLLTINHLRKCLEKLFERIFQAN